MKISGNVYVSSYAHHQVAAESPLIRLYTRKRSLSPWLSSDREYEKAFLERVKAAYERGEDVSKMVA